MAKFIIHFLFALIIVSFLLSISEAYPERGIPEPYLCRCPNDPNPDCSCLPLTEDYQALTTSAISPVSTIELLTRCNRNSDCNGVCPLTCKYKVCMHNNACDCYTCHCYIC